MTPSGADYIRQIKEQIAEVDPSEVHELLDERRRDRRRPRERGVGRRAICPAPSTSPRGYLESRIDGAVPDRSQRVILYCASGNRSALAAKTLLDELGYEHVESMTGGITLWKDRGYEVEVPRALTPEQRERYSRHFLLPEVGVEGQQKLLDAKVLLLGAGGLGSPTALYLAAAGVGTLGIVDDDVVDLSNLQRQVIHTTDRVGVPKVDSAEQAIKALNPDVEVVKYETRLDASNIMDDHQGLRRHRRRRRQLPDPLPAQRRVRAPADPGRVGGDPRLRRASCRSSSPTRARATAASTRQPPPAELAPSCGANGVLGVLPGTMGLLQATEVVKLILGVGEPLIGRLLLYDALGATFTELKVRRDPECPICSRAPDDDHRRGDGRLPRLRGVLRRRRLARVPSAYGDGPHPARPAPVRRAASKRGRRRRPTRRRGPRSSLADAASRDDAGQLSAPTASSTATSTSTSTTRTSACSTGSTTRSATGDMLGHPARHGRRLPAAERRRRRLGLDVPASCSYDFGERRWLALTSWSWRSNRALRRPLRRHRRRRSATRRWSSSSASRPSRACASGRRWSRSTRPARSRTASRGR